MTSSIQDVYNALHARNSDGANRPSSAASRQSTLEKTAGVPEQQVDKELMAQVAALSAISKETQMKFTGLLTQVFESGVEKWEKSSQENLRQFSDFVHQMFQSTISKIQEETRRDLENLLRQPDLKRLDSDALARGLGLGMFYMFATQSNTRGSPD